MTAAERSQKSDVGHTTTTATDVPLQGTRGTGDSAPFVDALPELKAALHALRGPQRLDKHDEAAGGFVEAVAGARLGEGVALGRRREQALDDVRQGLAAAAAAVAVREDALRLDEHRDVAVVVEDLNALQQRVRGVLLAAQDLHSARCEELCMYPSWM